MQTSARQRLGGRLESRIPTVEYVNRLGEPVSPNTGRPYDKPSDSGTNGLTKSRSRRRRRLPVKRVGSMFGNLEVIPTDVTRDPPPRACFNCWQQGHPRRECPRPLTARYCNNCGRRGEDLRSCPRCSRAHNEYLVRLQARERGEEVEPEEVADESFLVGEGDENDDACDEVLRELIYQDDRARELRRSSYNQQYQEAYSHAPDALDAPDAPDARDHRHTDPDRDREEDGEEYIKREYNAYNNYSDSRDCEEEDRDARINSRNSRQQEREYEENYSHRDYRKYPEYRDKGYRSEYYKEKREREEVATYRGGERERDYEARGCRAENRKDEREKRKVTDIFDDEVLDLEADPVQEVLQLAKSIAHLTPETQDLIMRQVMAERKERVRLRAIKLQERRADASH